MSTLELKFYCKALLLLPAQRVFSVKIGVDIAEKELFKLARRRVLRLRFLFARGAFELQSGKRMKNERPGAAESVVAGLECFISLLCP